MMMALLPVFALQLLVTARCAAAQASTSSLSDDDNDPYRSHFDAATAILIVVIVTGFFFLAFFSVYFSRCSRDRSAVSPAEDAAVSRRPWRGLDPAVIGTLPILSYSAAAGLKIGKEALECAVCLSEFSADETLRMLPRCCHVFHPECIGTWLEAHVTCPVCRDDLSVVPTTTEIRGAEEEIGNDDDEAAIDVRMRMGRSHSMGHVVDRYTLRLPEHVRIEIVTAAAGLGRSASVAGLFRGEGSSRRGYRGGSLRRSVWAGLSDRWASGILTRVSTWRRGEASSAEGSLRGGAAFGCKKVRDVELSRV